MRNIIIIIASVLLLQVVPATAEEIHERWKSLNTQYLEMISTKKYETSLQIALELNRIDPSDTRAMLYIVFASIKAGKQIPSWVFDNPWPDATRQDIFYRQLAEQLNKSS